MKIVEAVPFEEKQDLCSQVDPEAQEMQWIQ
jgi:hypothetical protein